MGILANFSLSFWPSAAGFLTHINKIGRLGKGINQASPGSTQESTQETNKSTQEMILDEIRKHPFTTREQLAKVIGITPDGIKKQLDTEQ